MSSHFSPTPTELALVNRIFAQADTQKIGILTGDTAVRVFSGAKLSLTVLGEIWSIADEDNNGFLTRKGVAIAVRLMGWAQKGEKISSALLSKSGPLATIDGVQPPLAPQGTGIPKSPQPSLSLLTPQDKAKFARLFQSSGPENGLLNGEKARDVFVKSKLPLDKLSQIWTLADTQDRGALDLIDFTIAMYLIRETMSGQLSYIPESLPPGLYEQAGGAFVVTHATGTSTQPATPLTSPVLAAVKRPPVQTNFTGQPNQGLPRRSLPVAQTPTIPSFSGVAPQAIVTWGVTPAEKASADRFFDTLDWHKRGYIEGDVAVPFMLQSKLPEDVLAQVWDLADINNDGRLTRDGFAVAMHLIQGKLSGMDIPTSLLLKLERENEILDADKRELQAQVDALQAALRQEQMKAKREASSSSMANWTPWRSFGTISHAVAGPSRISGAYNRSTETLCAAPPRHPRPTHPSPATGTSGAQSIFAHNSPPVPSTMPPAYDDPDLDDKSSTDLDDLWVQTAYVARELQDQFDSEDRRLRQEQAELARYIQTTFQCSVCMDELPEDDVAKIDDCVHMMCRSCLRVFVSSKIEEHRYPIFCPMCTVTAKGKAQPGVISRFLIEQLGISEKHFRILTEMELAEFTIQIHCRECRRPAFVDREDYSDAINIVCPQQDCHHVWCKKCEQTIVVDGPKHSCDGSSELDHLMKEKGWKHCPNCTTPIQKETGCNHMACISPWCNTHFCYVCGGMIIRSVLNHEINQAVSAHFRKCQLFEVPN